MKNKKNIVIVGIIIILILSIIVLSKYISVNNLKLKGSVVDSSTASTTVYKDWDEFSSIENDYSYSTLIYTKDTKIYVNAGSGVSVAYRDKVENVGTNVLINGTAVPLITFNSANSKAQVIITNCAIDKDGQLISAVFDLTADSLWHNDFARFSMLPLSNNTGTQNNPDISGGERWHTISYNQPLKFYLEGSGGTVKASLTYYKTLKLKNVDENHYTTPFDFGNIEVSGSTPGKALNYAQVDTDKSIIATNINKVNAFYQDIDVSTSFDNNQLFDGKEGVMPLNGSTTIYYNKSGSTTFNNATVGNVKIKLVPDSNGIKVEQNTLMPTQYNINGIWYGQDAEFLTENISGKYSFAYSGSGCGIAFVFFSPKGYEIDSPNKEVSKDTVSVGEEFYYEISQYIPNNYYTSIIDFSTVSDKFSKDNLLKKITIYDKIDSRLTIDQSNITITDINSTDLSSYFTVSVNNNEVTAVSNSSATTFFKTKDIYNNTITLTIPVVYNEDITESQTVLDVAQVTTRLGESTTDKTNSTREVQTIINPLKLTYDCTTNGGEPKFKTTTLYMRAGQNVDVGTTKYVCTKEGNSFVGWATAPTNETVLSKFTMPNVDTTLYAIYKPLTCDTILKSTIYEINETTKTVNVPKDESNNDILKNVTTTGTKTINNEMIEVECEGNVQVYKINRYSVFKTGQNVVKYTAVIIGILGILAILFYIRKKSSE